MCVNQTLSLYLIFHYNHNQLYVIKKIWDIPVLPEKLYFILSHDMVARLFS